MISVLLPPVLTGAIAFIVMIAVLVTCFLLFLPFALLKLLVPVRRFRNACTDVMFAVVRLWGDLNEIAFRAFYPLHWEIEINGVPDPSRSYLLLSNHQSWIDILLLVHVFRHRAPPPCFFLKRELLWVPIIGFACWAFDFPFMKRHTREAIARNPALRGEDLEATRRACHRFRDRPVTMINFAEGTRSNEAKRLERRSPYRHLLRPKAAGIALALNSMGDQFAGVIDVTIAYRASRHSPVWSFLTGEQTHLAVRVDMLPVPAELVSGDYLGDESYRARVQDWINAIWSRKDARLDHLIPAAAPARPRTT